MTETPFPVENVSSHASLNGTHPPNLQPHHYEMLRASSISDEITIARGYRSVDDPALLARYGFNQAQRRLGSGLYIPMYSTTGEEVPGQFRPDKPRTIRDRIIKYETPAGSTMRLDVLPLNVESIKNPSIPLVVTEGIKKSDSGASRRLCIIGLLGVYNWRGRNEYGGLTALADWDSIALKDRKVILCFDNDYKENVSVLMALHRLSAFLRNRGARVAYIDLPSGPKLGVDDYLAQGHTLDDLLALEVQRLPEIPKQSQAERLMAIAESELRLIYTDGGERMATVTYADGHREVLAIGERGSSARDWLLRRYRQEYRGSFPSTTALSQVTEALGAYCPSHGERVEVFTRVAYYEGKLYLDLANDKGEAVEIDANGWRITREPAVYFRKPPGMKPLPAPFGGASAPLPELLAKLLA